MRIDYAIYPTLLDNFYFYKIDPFGKMQELIDKCNRVKTNALPEAAAKGVHFESVVNATMSGQWVDHDYGDLPARIANKLINAKQTQKYVEGIIETCNTRIKIYGFVDYAYDDKFIDLKTTEKYKASKYNRNNQHAGYTLADKVSGGSVQDFIYLVTDFQDIFTERYKPNSADHDQFICNVIEFTQWLEIHRNIIYDKKIFGQ